MLLSGAPAPVAIVRNVNSSARLKSTEPHLISGPDGRYRKNRRHEVKLVYHSAKGTLEVICDGSVKLEEAVTKMGTHFAGLSFSKAAALSGCASPRNRCLSPRRRKRYYKHAVPNWQRKSRHCPRGPGRQAVSARC